MKKASSYFLLVFLIILVVFLIANKRSMPSTGTVYPEVRELQGVSSSFDALSKYFIDLAEKKGAPYAFEVLMVASIPPNIDMHLLGHTVGDILYRQQGLEGIKVCTNDFRNACSHSIVIGLFSEKGEEALFDIAEACREAPGGSGAYTMCFHGLGHGILAYTGYELEKTVELCKKTGTPEYHNQEYSQCASGSIMEIVNGGFHDRELWAAQRKKYFKPDDPLYPCSSSFIDQEARYLCYVYLTPHLWEAVGGNIDQPMPADFAKAFPLCNKLSLSDVGNRDACYGGFGKEFVGLVQGRDIRLGALASISDRQLLQIYDWCLLADQKEGSAACMMQAMQSLYWGGENDRGIAIRFCTLMVEPYYQRSCFINLIGAVSFYIKDLGYKKEFCEELPGSHQEECRTRLRIP